MFILILLLLIAIILISIVDLSIKKDRNSEYKDKIKSLETRNDLDSKKKLARMYHHGVPDDVKFRHQKIESHTEKALDKITTDNKLDGFL